MRNLTFKNNETQLITNANCGEVDMLISTVKENFIKIYPKGALIDINKRETIQNNAEFCSYLCEILKSENINSIMECLLTSKELSKDKDKNKLIIIKNAQIYNSEIIKSLISTLKFLGKEKKILSKLKTTIYLQGDFNIFDWHNGLDKTMSIYPLTDLYFPSFRENKLIKIWQDSLKNNKLNTKKNDLINTKSESQRYLISILSKSITPYVFPKTTSNINYPLINNIYTFLYECIKGNVTSKKVEQIKQYLNEEQNNNSNNFSKLTNNYNPISDIVLDILTGCRERILSVELLINNRVPEYYISEINKSKINEIKCSLINAAFFNKLESLSIGSAIIKNHKIEIEATSWEFGEFKSSMKNTEHLKDGKEYYYFSYSTKTNQGETNKFLKLIPLEYDI